MFGSTCVCYLFYTCFYILYIYVKFFILVDVERWYFWRGLREIIVIVWVEGGCAWG